MTEDTTRVSKASPHLVARFGPSTYQACFSRNFAPIYTVVYIIDLQFTLSCISQGGGTKTRTTPAIINTHVVTSYLIGSFAATVLPDLPVPVFVNHVPTKRTSRQTNTFDYAAPIRHVSEMASLRIVVRWNYQSNCGLTAYYVQPKRF